MSATAAKREEVARLLGRAAFGATRDDLDRWEGRPYAEIVDALLDVPEPSARAPMPDEERRLALEEAGRSAPAIRTPEPVLKQAQRWWLERMRTTPYPLEERMVLLWHNHFATALRVPFPNVGMLLAQNETLRRHALGRFGDLLRAVTLDPAMLDWLDGGRNAAPVPNENYARELFELFALGTSPQVYGELDVREAARCLTGWSLEPNSRVVTFVQSRHDKGTKRVLGETVRNAEEREYERVVDIALRQPVAARHLAWRIVAGFAYVPQRGDLLREPDPLVAKVATTLQATGWDLRAAMRTLLVSPEFRAGDPATGRVRVRQPAEVAVATAKALRLSLDVDRAADAVTRMGQRLFVPPNVGGWPLGTHWISPATAIARYDWGVLAEELWRTRPGFARAPLPASGDARAWAALLGLAELSTTTQAAVAGYLASRRGAGEAERQAGVLVLLLSSPDWTVM